jgi:4-hydroxybenzoate polyprenyltransferase
VSDHVPAPRADQSPAPRTTVPIGPMVKALRPKQWTKNGLVFAALIFAYQFDELGSWILALGAFAAFCLVSSMGYLVNDIRDREADAQHPTKCRRPIASGALPMRWAIGEAIAAGALGLFTAAVLGWEFLLVTVLYFATTMSYSFFFKHVVILDVMMITVGFLWRAVAGAVVIDVHISPWLLLCAAFLALFLGFNKRRGEIALITEDDQDPDTEELAAVRPSLASYRPSMIAEFQSITSSGTVISYALYTVLGSPTPWLMVTMPFVLYGVFRYIYLVDRGDGAAPDEILVRDKHILLTVVLYGITALLVLILAPHEIATP